MVELSTLQTRIEFIEFVELRVYRVPQILPVSDNKKNILERIIDFFYY